MRKTRLDDIIVLLPGITGSVLQRHGKDLWAFSAGALWRAATSLGSSLDHLYLDKDDFERDILDDGIRATRLMRAPHMIPGLSKIDGYGSVVEWLTDAFDVIPGEPVPEGAPANFFEFPYDWRRDNRVAARQLKRFIDARLTQWRESLGPPDAKLILLAHSMGGLVARYYLEVLGGWEKSKALITFGTPYRGSLDALNYLENGFKNVFVDLTNIVRSFTSVYQLLPIYKVIKKGKTFYRVAEVSNLRWVAQGRAEEGLRFHREIEAAVEEHEKDAKYRRSYRTIPVVGTRQPTRQSAELSMGTLIVGRDLPEGIDPLLADGDGRVPRLSAIPIELSEEYRDTYIAERHSSLQKNPDILGRLAERIKGMQVRGLKVIRGPEVSPAGAQRAGIAVEVDDLFLPGEPVVVRARLVNAPDSMGVEAVLQSDEPGHLPLVRRLQEGSHGWVVTMEGLPPGLYRLEVRTIDRGPKAPTAVHDLFEVAG